MPDFRLPDLGEGLTEAEIVAWRVAVGDTVEVDQVVAEVETAKAAVEVPVPFAGVVRRLHGRPGELVAVGALLVSVEPAAFVEPGVGTPDADLVQSGHVLVGYGTSAPARRHRTPRRSRPAGEPSSRAVAVISPLVRKLARDHGLDLRGLAGTGTDGVIVRRDVEAALGDPRLEPSGERRIPLRGVRRLTAEKLTRSRREIPEATVWVDVDATALLEARTAINARIASHGRPPHDAAPVNDARPADDTDRIGVFALVARFAVLGLRRYPELNARIEGDEIVLPASVHLGFAAQTERGLVVPVVRDADGMSTRQLNATLQARTASARAGTLALTDLSGGTFTINNYGVFGVDGSAAIINHPEVAILGLGRIAERPWVVDGQLAVRQVTQLTLAFDHRACDGATAGGFLRFVADCVESPLGALADL